MTHHQVRRVAFLLGEAKLARNDNHERLPAAFAAAGWEVECYDHAQIASYAGEIFLAAQPASQFDLIWPVGFGPHSTFADRLQLWSQLGSRLINRAACYVTHHGKATLHQWLPETHCAGSAEALIPRLSKPHSWVLKPLAGSYGQGVTKIGTGDVASLQAAFRKMPGFYALQRFQPEIADGENRTLMVGHTLIGSYRRVPQRAFTANLASGGNAQTVELGAAERELTAQVAAELNTVGVRFAAIDTAWPYLVEINMANPGGLGTLSELYDQEFDVAAVRAISSALAAND